MSINLTDMDETPLVSIIVPVYQVKAYISECVESLLAQTYTNLEILLVDDGSTDGSGAVCDEYAVRDSRVRVVHQENQGAAGARNAGLDLASGEYVAFVDSDDVIAPAYVKELFLLLKKYQADIAACAYGRDQLRETGDTGELCMSSEQMLRQWHGKYKRWETIPWNKLYNRAVFEGGGKGGSIRFPVGRRHEDVLISHLLINNAEKVALTKKVLYCYRTRSGSCSTNILASAENREQNLRAQRERMAFFKERHYFRAYLNLWVGYMLHRVWFGWMRVIGNK